MGKRVNQTELAAILGVSDVTLWEWQKDGMPIVERGERGQANVYDTSEVIAWKIEREVQKVRAESPQDELNKAKTQLIRLQIAEKEKDLVAIAEVKPAILRMIMASRQKLLQLPARLAHELEAAVGVENKRVLLEERIDEALRELAAYEPSGEPGAGGGEGVGAAVADVGRPVGGGETPP
jgi:phage terminase Nu1 subunit (DNA packaging protein)